MCNKIYTDSYTQDIYIQYKNKTMKADKKEITKLIDLPKKTVTLLTKEASKEYLKVKPFIEKILIEKAKEYENGTN